MQELPAIEGLARVDVVCVDKTGTLTEGPMTFDCVEPVAGGPGDHDAALAALAAADDSPNPSLLAIRAATTSPGWRAEQRVAFSSARKWSAASFGPNGTWVLGAPEVLLSGHGDGKDAAASAERWAAAGRRVLLLARARALQGESLPGELHPAALVVLQEQIRPDAADTLAYFATQDVQVKVISGDHPETVGAVARRVGLAEADTPVDARRLADASTRGDGRRHGAAGPCSVGSRRTRSARWSRRCNRGATWSP